MNNTFHPALVSTAPVSRYLREGIYLPVGATHITETDEHARRSDAAAAASCTKVAPS